MPTLPPVVPPPVVPPPVVPPPVVPPPVVPPPVVPPPVVPPPVVPPPVVPPLPPHSAAHSLVQLLQMQSPMALNLSSAGWPAVLAQLCWQVASVQPLRQVIRAVQAESEAQVLYEVSQEPPVLST